MAKVAKSSVEERQRALHLFLSLALLALASLSFSVRTFLLDPPALGWDEGVHLEDALTAYRELTTGSIKGFILYLDSPMYYPFVHSVLIAITWLVTGISEAGARWVGVAMSLMLIPGVLWLGRLTLPPEQRDRAILFATAATLASPELLRLQGQVMLDVTGTALTVFALVTWVRWLERDTWARAAAAIATVLATYFTKYNFGVVLGATLLLHGILARAGFQRLYRATLLLAGPTLLWLYQEPAKKLTLLSEYLINRTLEKSAFEQWTFPLVSTVQDHAPWSIFGVIFVAAYAVAWSRVQLRSPAGVLLLLPVVQGLAQASSAAQLPRYILPAAPALYLMAAVVLAPWRASGRGRRIVDLAVVALAASMLRDPSTVMGNQSCYSHRVSLRAAVHQLAQHRGEGPMILVGGFAELPPSIGRFAGVQASTLRGDGQGIDAPPLFLPCPPAFHYTRQRLWPLTAHDAATIFCQGLSTHMNFHDQLSLAIVRVHSPSKLRGYDYVHYNEWQEVLIDLLDRHRSRLTTVDRHVGVDFTVELVRLDRGALSDLCLTEVDVRSSSGGQRRP